MTTRVASTLQFFGRFLRHDWVSDALARWEQLLIFIAGDAFCLPKHYENIRSEIKRDGVWDKQHIAATT